MESLQKYIIWISKKQEQFQNLYLQMLSEWQMTGIESGYMFNSLQRYIIRIAKKQGQFQKL